MSRYKINHSKNKRNFVYHKFISRILSAASLRKAVWIFLLLSCAMLIWFLNLFGYFNSYCSYYFNLLSKKTGLIVENVYIAGQDQTTNDQVIKAIDVKIGQPIAFVKLYKVKEHLEEIPWIKSASVKRKLPNTILINIEEKKPVALWQNAGKVQLIDRKGAIITDKNVKQFGHLVILVGDDSNLYANYLLTLLGKNKDIFKRIAAVIRVGERRWNVRLDNGLEVKLPEKNPEKAWDYIIKLYKEKNLFAEGAKTIDLRMANKLYVE